MASYRRINCLLALSLLTTMVGCAGAWGRRASCDCGDQCGGCDVVRTATAAYQGELADDAVCCSRCFGQGCSWCDRLVRPVTCGPECAECRTCRFLPFGLGDKLCEKPTPGPPPMTYVPPMPPKFLPMPTEPILSPVRPNAPEPQRGNVDLGWRPQMTISDHN